MTKEDFYAETAVRQARKAVQFHDKYYTALALNTVYVAYINGLITVKEWIQASAMIHRFAHIHNVDY